MAPKTKSILPYFALLVGALSLGISPFFVRWSDSPGPVFAFFRMALATLILAPFVIRKQRQDPVRLDRSTLLFPALAGLATTGDLTLWTLAIQHTKAANATLMNNVAPLWVALVAWLIFKERLRGSFWVGLILALAGSAFILGTDMITHPSLGSGDVMGIISSLFYAGYYLATQVGRVRLDTLRYIWIMDLTCSIGLLIFTQVLGMPLAGYSLPTYLAFAGAAISTQVIGYFSIAYALGHLPASLVSPTLISQPVIVAVLAIPVLGENLTTNQWIGGIAVLSGIYLVHRSRTAESKDQQAAVEVELPPNTV